MATRFQQHRFAVPPPSTAYQPPNPLDSYHSKKRECGRINLKIEKLTKKLQLVKTQLPILQAENNKNTTPKQIKKHAKRVKKMNKKIQKFERKIKKNQSKLNEENKKLEICKLKAQKYVDIR